MWSKFYTRQVTVLIFFIVTVMSAGIVTGQEGGVRAVSSEELQRCVENKKRKARQDGAAAFDLMDMRFACYQEIIRGKKY